MSNPFLTRLEKRQHGQQAEKRAAKRVGGRLQPGSGSQQHSKADFKTTGFLFESKSTVNGSLSIKHSWLEKISHEARGINREAALIVQFVDAQGRIVKDGSWVMVREDTFQGFLE